VISLPRVFEPFAWYDVFHFSLALLERCSLAYTVWALDCADCSFEQDHFLSQVCCSLPAFVSAPEAFVPDIIFSYYCFFCGIGVVPGFYQEFLGFI